MIVPTVEDTMAVTLNDMMVEELEERHSSILVVTTGLTVLSMELEIEAVHK